MRVAASSSNVDVTAVPPARTLRVTDALTTSCVDAMTAIHNSGTGANGVGVGILLQATNSAGTETNVVEFCGLLTNATSGSETSALVINARTGGAALAEVFRVAGSGLVTVTGKITGLTQATAATDAVAGGRTLTGGTGISPIGDLTSDRTISVNQSFSPTWTGTHTFSAAPTISVDDATNNAVTTVLTLRHTTTGTAQANIGTGLLFMSEDGLGNNENVAAINAILTTVTNNSEVGALNFQTRTGGGALTNRWQMTGAGDWVPGANSTYNVGAAGTVVIQVFGSNFGVNSLDRLTVNSNSQQFVVTNAVAVQILGNGVNSMQSGSHQNYDLGANGTQWKRTFTGGFFPQRRSTSGSNNVNTNGIDCVIEYDTSGGTGTGTLPAPANVGLPSSAGWFVFRDSTQSWAANNFTLARNASEKIDGKAANFTGRINNSTIWAWSNGTDWFTLNSRESTVVDSGTTTTINGYAISRRSTGTAGIGLGGGLLYSLDNASGTLKDAAQISVEWRGTNSATAGSENSSIVFSTMVAGAAAAEAMRVHGASLGIGTTTTAPNTTFHVATSGFPGTAERNSTDAGAPGFIFRKTRGTFGSPSGVSANDKIGAVYALGYTSASAYGSNSGAIEWYATEAFSGTAQGTAIMVQTTASTTTTMAAAAAFHANGGFSVDNTLAAGTAPADPSTIVLFRKNDTTAGVTDVLTLTHSRSDGAGTNNIGVGLLLAAENTSNGTVVNAGRISGILSTATSGSEIGDIVLAARGNGTLNEGIRVRGTSGGATALGFYAVTPVARPAAYTQTYSATTRTHAQAAVDTTGSTQTTPFGYTTAAQADAIPTAINELKNLVNQVIDDLQANGLLQ